MSDLPSVLHSAYTFVRSIETNKSISSITLDRLVQEHINSLKKGETTSLVDGKGGSVGSRISRWDALDTLEKNIDAVVQAVQNAGDDPDKLNSIDINEAGAEGG